MADMRRLCIASLGRDDVLIVTRKLVEKRFVQSPLGREFVPLLDPQASEALGRLKKRFGIERGTLKLNCRSVVVK
jgi:hypothetical protein